MNQNFAIKKVDLDLESDRYLAFIYDSWLQSFKYMSQFAKNIHKDVFFPRHRAVINEILGRDTTEVFIAHAQEDEDLIFGYMVSEPIHNKVHFTFVKQSFRNLRIATELIQYSGINRELLVFSHWTYPMNVIARHHPEFTYDPYF